MLKTFQLGVTMAIGVAAAQAQTAVVSSAPVGFMKVTIKGKGEGSGANFVGAPFVREAVYTGYLNDGTVVANVLADGDANWSAGEFTTSSVAASHYVEIVNSTNADAIGLLSDIVSHTTNTLRTADDLSPWLVGGEQICIREHHTLSSLFGESNEVGLAQGTNDSADTISILRPGENAAFSTYYYRDAQLGGSGWRSSSNPFTNEQERSVRPTDGLYIQRSATTDLTVVMHGEVRQTPTKVVVQPGLNMIGTMAPVTDATATGGAKVTLGGAASESLIPSGLGDVLGQGDSATADTVSIFDGSQFRTYYLKDGTSPLGGTGWRSVANPFEDASGVVLPEAGAVLVRNKGEARIWTLPLPF
ncbi:MAG: TIGR02597 family protein [Verrucomicrobiae bacterium]|nr:TIGR02597 family protein [Verrucomicrobiae bacterium]